MTDQQAASEVVPTPDVLDQVDTEGLKVAVVRAALELDVFTHVTAGETTVDALASRCSTSVRGMATLVRALQSLELLEVTSGGLRCSAAAAAYMSEQGRGDSRAIYLSWLRNRDRLVDAIRSGRPVGDHGTVDAAAEWRSYAAPDLVRWPVRSEAIAAILRDRGLVLAAGGRVLDLGCGSGLVGFTVVREVPDAGVVAVDRAPVLDVARQLATAMGVEDRASFVDADVTTMELEPASFDLILLTNVAQYLDDDQLDRLLRRTRAALRPGGTFQLSTVIVDDGSPGWQMNWGSAVEMYLVTEVPQRDAAAVSERLAATGYTGVRQVGPNAFVGRP